MKEQIMAVQRMQDYIRRLRLAKAALQIKNEHIRMIDAAFDLGFGSVDGASWLQSNSQWQDGSYELCSGASIFFD